MASRRGLLRLRIDDAGDLASQSGRSGHGNRHLGCGRRAGASANEHKVCERTKFRRMDAEALEFDLMARLISCAARPSSTTWASPKRILRPPACCGRAAPACSSNRLGRTPQPVSQPNAPPANPEEHPLVEGDFDLAHRYFGEVDLSFFHLAGLLAIPLRKRSSCPKVLSALDAADRGLFKTVPAAGKHGWMAVMRLGAPTTPLPARAG